MQASAWERLWLKTPPALLPLHSSPSLPPSTLPLTSSPHIGCQNCLSQFFLAGRQDTDFAASGLSGTNVSVYFPVPTIILLDIWWQCHLEWRHENKYESRWKLKQVLNIFRYAQATRVHCTSFWFTCCCWMAPNWWCKTPNQTTLI